jgi:4-aminobutyrate aminotransferase / (S)-3-amino-2-methylpropionate transaminase / 5-aminovalerate transaminase
MQGDDMDGLQLPSIRTAVPGPASQAWIDRLAQRECPAITARRARRASSLGRAEDDPIVWKEAVGSNIMDVDGNIYVDLTAGFGVAGAGHRNASIAEAGKRQLGVLLHAMGDAFPDPTRIELMESLCMQAGMDRAILGSSGSDAVEAALKTAKMATGRPGVLAFHQGYHGLSYGALAATDYNASAFRGPFGSQLGDHVRHREYGGELPADLSSFGAVLVEPIQGRGGIRVPPNGWLAELIDRANRDGSLVVFDEIYTGFGRTGDWFAFQHSSLQGRRPDLICLGKALAGGFPISACLGTAAAMDAWGASSGQAIHTQTFLGNPLGCAMGLASIEALKEIVPEVPDKSRWLRGELEHRGFSVRGRGLMLGIERKDALLLSRRLLGRGFLALPAGPTAEVLAITPPLTITAQQLEAFVSCLQEICSS